MDKTFIATDQNDNVARAYEIVHEPYHLENWSNRTKTPVEASGWEICTLFPYLCRIFKHFVCSK